MGIHERKNNNIEIQYDFFFQCWLKWMRERKQKHIDELSNEFVSNYFPYKIPDTMYTVYTAYTEQTSHTFYSDQHYIPLTI